MSWMKKLEKGLNKLQAEVESGINDLKGKKNQPPLQAPGQYYQQPGPPGPPPPGPRPEPQQHPGYGHGPPPPTGPRPPAAPGSTAYWRPRFQQDIPVTVEWDAKIGNGPDGWGNQELQFYTAEPENAFQ
jgi:hypothetical protein